MSEFHPGSGVPSAEIVPGELTYDNNSTELGRQVRNNGLAFGSIFLLFSVILIAPVRHYHGVGIVNYLVAMITSALSLLCFRNVSPWRLTLHIPLKTFTMIEGYRPLTSIREGSFADIDGIRTRSYTRPNYGPKQGLVEMKISTLGRTLLVDYSPTPLEAKTKAQRLAKLLNVPLLGPLDSTPAQIALIEQK